MGRHRRSFFVCATERSSMSLPKHKDFAVQSLQIGLKSNRAQETSILGCGRNGGCGDGRTIWWCACSENLSTSRSDSSAFAPQNLQASGGTSPDDACPDRGTSPTQIWSPVCGRCVGFCSSGRRTTARRRTSPKTRTPPGCNRRVKHLTKRPAVYAVRYDRLTAPTKKRQFCSGLRTGS